MLQRGKSGPEPGVARHHTVVLDGDVQILADEHPASREVQVGHREDVHRATPSPESPCPRQAVTGGMCTPFVAPSVPVSPAVGGEGRDPVLPRIVIRGLPLQAAFINATVVSSIRFEKPHSLSYHATTLTSRPSMTRVSFES